MRQRCVNGKKKEHFFTPTSWTRDNFWRDVCPKCIVELLEKNVGKDQVLAAFKGDEVNARAAE